MEDDEVMQADARMLGDDDRARASVPLQHLGHPLLQARHQFPFEPRMATQPDVVARAGMGQGHDAWPERRPATHGFGEPPSFLGQMPGHGVLTDHQGQAQIRQFIQ